MKILKRLEELRELKELGGSAVALGNFDGIHKGHRELILRMTRQAQKDHLVSTVFTFTNHPRNVIAGERVVKNILYWDEKVAILKDLGVECLVSLEFTHEIQHMEPSRFVKELLIDELGMKEAFCGFNYKFGCKGRGNLQVLSELGEELGFGVKVTPPYKIDGELVSSTLIRQLIASGRMEECSKFLGRNYTMGGTVVEGNHLGRSIGFPTTNIEIDETMVIPPNGVYATLCDYGGTSYPSITNLGRKPTVGQYRKNIETHIFNFNSDIYGRDIRIEFLKKIRDERKFDVVEALSEQIRRDCLSAAEYHRSNWDGKVYIKDMHSGSQGT